MVIGAGTVVVEGTPSVSEDVATVVVAPFVNIPVAVAVVVAAGINAGERDDDEAICAAGTDDAFSANAIGKILKSQEVPDEDAVAGGGAGVGVGVGAGALVGVAVFVPAEGAVETGAGAAVWDISVLAEAGAEVEEEDTTTGAGVGADADVAVVPLVVDAWRGDSVDVDVDDVGARSMIVASVELAAKELLVPEPSAVPVAADDA